MQTYQELKSYLSVRYIGHPAVGFGVMDAKKLVDVAQHWINVPKQIMCSYEENNKM